LKETSLLGMGRNNARGKVIRWRPAELREAVS
jgi:hypothetical protein